MKKQFLGFGLFTLSGTIYLGSLASSIALIYFLQQKFVNKINNNGINNGITISATLTVLAFVLAVATMIGVNVIIQDKQKQIDIGYSSTNRGSTFNDCFSDLLLWWLCCGPREVNICSGNNLGGSVNGKDDAANFCVVFLAIFSVAACMAGYVVYAFKTAKKLCDLSYDNQNTKRENYASSSSLSHSGNLHGNGHNLPQQPPTAPEYTLVRNEECYESSLGTSITVSPPAYSEHNPYPTSKTSATTVINGGNVTINNHNQL
ncbi:MAG: hypothetical protein HRK26_03245 [Rickettsiaceae bacterium H1]|nr:hypothetical protein [Rickettsiaceae bacterium H1]